MRREVRWERMFPDELEAAFDACPVVYLPYGLCEPHGPQCTLGLDALKAHGICCAAAREHGGIVAPPDYWHIHELSGYATWSAKNVGEVRSWLTAMPPWMHFKNVCYHLRAVDAMGFHAAILVTGHYGPNWNDLKTLTALVQPRFATRIYSLPDLEANVPGFDNDNHSGGDHAGKVETSLLWAVEPDCVDMSRLPEKGEPGFHFAMADNAIESDRRTGQRMVEDEVRWLGAKARELLDAYAKSPPAGRRPLTFDETEQVWEQLVRPELPSFRTMQDSWKNDEPPADSIWRANWKVPSRG
ncbi:MAG: hypothetical protein CMJ18_13185 [Phycisphaeraceae bacterium]|nr:hypothetical protein [Phycisphaeraceae bacterium]